MGEAKTFLELTYLLGGFTPENIQSWIFVKSPLALHHWTMNVVEILLLIGAGWGLRFSIGRFRSGETIYLGFWLASVIFMLAIEVPVYFPELLGGQSTSLYFIHNEFTVNFFFGRAPLYIMGLYPALMFTSFALVRHLGLVSARFPLVSLAIAVGLVHHIFYEIFDQFGPQYRWWIWNYANFGATLASVPLGSVLGFAFAGPVGLTLAVGWLWRRELAQAPAPKQSASPWLPFLGRAIFAGLATPILMILIIPGTWFAVMGVDMTLEREQWSSWLVLASAGLLTLWQVARKTQWGLAGIRLFPVQYLGLFLAVFVGLWAFAWTDYRQAVAGITASGAPIGSLSYVCLCGLLGALLLMRRPKSAEDN